ncbi:MAG: carbon-nitrogen hydrolase family protein [Armatimonadota bacterium]
MKLRIAGAQIAVSENVAENLRVLRRAVEFASGEGAHILLTPEGALSGYTHRFDIEQVTDALAEITAHAKALQVGLALGTCFIEPDDGRCYNQLRFYTPDGAYLGFHSKILTCGTLTEPTEGEINHFAIKPLRTFDFLGVTIGGLICNDLWAFPECTPVPDPHLTHQLSRLGARVIFHAVNGARDGSERSMITWQYQESNLLLRSAASAVWVVTTDNCYPTHLHCAAPGGVISPDGKWVCRSTTMGEQFFTYTIDID